MVHTGPELFHTFHKVPQSVRNLQMGSTNSFPQEFPLVGVLAVRWVDFVLRGGVACKRTHTEETGTERPWITDLGGRAWHTIL